MYFTVTTILYLQQISVWIRHIANAQQPPVARGYCIGGQTSSTRPGALTFLSPTTPVLPEITLRLFASYLDWNCSLVYLATPYHLKRGQCFSTWTSCAHSLTYPGRGDCNVCTHVGFICIVCSTLIFCFASQADRMAVHILGTQKRFVVLKQIALDSLQREGTYLFKTKPLIASETSAWQYVSYLQGNQKPAD